MLLKAEQITIQDNILSSPDTSFGGTDNGLVKMTETYRFDLKRFSNHLQLYNYYSCLNDFDDESSECQDDDDGTESDSTQNEKDDLNVLFNPPPKTMTIDAKDIQHRSGDKAFSQHLTRMKKRTTNGQLVIAAEQQLSRAHLPSATLANVDQVITNITQHRDLLRSFYYSESVNRRKRRQVKRRKRYLDIICSDEREFINGGRDKEKGAVVLFVGDRGYATGSRIKGFLRYGGKWKPFLHARYTTTLITNEHNTSQTCVYCFQKTMHPTSMTNGKLKTIKGTSVRTNPHCVLVKKRMSHQSRDAVSSLAIGITGLHAAVFGSPLGPFNHNQGISQHDTDKMHDATLSFCTRSEEWLELDELDT